MSTVAVMTRLPLALTNRACRPDPRVSVEWWARMLGGNGPAMSTAMMSAPSAARRTACARPCPRAAPVISATFPEID